MGEWVDPGRAYGATGDAAGVGGGVGVTPAERFLGRNRNEVRCGLRCGFFEKSALGRAAGVGKPFHLVNEKSQAIELKR